MNHVRVDLEKTVDHSYDIVIGNDLFASLAEGLSKLNLSKIAIVTDSTVKKLYGKDLFELFKKQGLNSVLVTIPAGEKSKNRTVKARIEDMLISEGFRRDSLILALGGGVVGDIAGFVASTYMRGIPYVYVPTTLLAMVDSSIGGKNGINTASGKNMIGTFYQPKRVFIDLAVLKTLPEKEFRNGITEMIKHGIISDEKFFIFMEDYLEKLLSGDEDALSKAIEWSSTIKRDVVEQDEQEESIRKILNFGHTIGHALEKVSDYALAHGEAVALGMVAEAKIAKAMSILNARDYQKIIDLIEKLGVSPAIPYSARKVLEHTSYDKKSSKGVVQYALPTSIGHMEIDVEAGDDVVLQVLSEMQ